ncbi:5'-3' exonuclease PLD4 isoform 2-T2 [Menidia menidia]
MPMVLRSRRSILPAQEGEVELQATPRRSNRLHERVEYESDESESETLPNRVMERDPNEPQEEEEAAEEAGLTRLKDCSVLLDRFHADDDEVLKKDPEEREDMSRRGGKPASRIPTFQKRPVGSSPGAEPPAPKRDAAVHAERPAGGSQEAPKPKPPEAGEAAPTPPPSACAPKLGSEAPSATGHSAGQSSGIAVPRIWTLPEPVHSPLLTASPRPSLRAGHDGAKSNQSEADATPDAPASYLPKEGSLCQKPQAKVTVSASGDTDRPAGSVLRTPTTPLKAIPVEAIMDEEPPWETEPPELAELKDSRSSSDAESEEGGEEEGAEEEGADWNSTEEQRGHLVYRSESPDLQKTADFNDSSEEPAKASSAKSTGSSGSSGFFLLCLLPAALLLAGGLGQHVWQYGLPLSAAQLAAQLELHWLEGFGFSPEPCSTDCRVRLVESIPEGLHQSPSSSSIADSWLHLLDRANSSVHIAAFYLTLRAGDLDSSGPSDSQGRKVFERLKQLQSKGVKLQVAVNGPQTSTKDTAELAAAGAEVTEVDLNAVTGGIVHTKLWVVDQKHLYLGSANMDWRSLTQVKELGLSVEDCSCLAQDAYRIFGVYRSIGRTYNGSLPPYWPARLSALSSSEKPLHLNINGVPARVYLSSAPPQISARGRSDDLSTILSIMDDAQEFIHISVMDYLPLSQFTKPLRFWPAIDSRLRAAACTRGVQVRLMVSCWPHSPPSMFNFLQSLLVLSRPPLSCNMDVRVFTVPSTAEQASIPFARVNHAKYMVTDRVLYIGTSNWSENYFTHTAGVGVAVNQSGSPVGEGQRTLQSQAQELFLRDWDSQYAAALPDAAADACPRSPR